MNTASFSIKRPIFITSIVIIVLVVGYISLQRLRVDLFPNIEIPVVVTTILYPGTSSEEIENLVTKPLEDEVATINGLKRITSTSQEGASIIVTEFQLETDMKDAYQQVKDKVSAIRYKLPDDIKEPVFRRFDPSNSPILRLALNGDLSATDLYDVANEDIKSKLEQIENVGSVQVLGGTRREVQVEIDRELLYNHTISAFTVANQLRSTGVNMPVGKFEQGPKETAYRTIGQFEKLDQINDSIINYSGDMENSISLKSVANVKDGAEDFVTRAYLYYPEAAKNTDNKSETRPALFLDVFKQSGSNTVQVADNVLKKIDKINDILKNHPGSPKLLLIYDGAKAIRANVADVKDTIIMGIILAILVVYLFLGNIRSTLITGIAIPNSIMGAFIIMTLFGFSLNLMTLMALSLTVGLLIDDAIVVRENIFRKLEGGLHPFKAADIGTTEVMLAVIATTMTVIAVFFPIGFLQGMIGRFFKEFGFTVVFAMIISLFDALTVAPFLSGYFAIEPKKANNPVVQGFDRFQTRLENIYSKAMKYSLAHPVKILLITGSVFLGSLVTLAFVPRTFMPDSNWGEFSLNIELPPGTSLDGTYKVLKEIEEKLKSHDEIRFFATVVGNDRGESNIGSIAIFLQPKEKLKITTNDAKEKIRVLLKDYKYAKPTVNNYDLSGMSGGGGGAFVINITGDDLVELEKYSEKVKALANKVPDLIEITTSSQGGKPEYQVQLDTKKMQALGVQPRLAGAELRYYVAGGVVGKLHQNGLEYDIRLRLKPEQRNLKDSYKYIKVPNMQQRLIPLSAISTASVKDGPAKITRQDRVRIIQIKANLGPGGAVGNAADRMKKLIEKEAPPPKGISYGFWGQSENFRELMDNILLAFALSFIFIFLVLASLYESFITPFTIFMAIPPALSGAFFALFITGQMLNTFSMIGCIMLIGLVTKNSILLVDFALAGVRAGLPRKEAIYRAGMLRLRPILMTTFAMIAGTLPLALGVGEAASYRQAMGVAIIGGLIVSTVLTLVAVPAVFEYIDRFREFIESKFRPKNIPQEYILVQEESEEMTKYLDDHFYDEKREEKREPGYPIYNDKERAIKKYDKIAPDKKAAKKVPTKKK